MIQRVHKIVEVPRIQYVDKIVDAPVVASHQPVPADAKTLRVEAVPDGTQTADGTSDAEHGLVQEEECRSEEDETRERDAAGEGLNLLQVALNMEAGGSHLQATTEDKERQIGPRTCARSAKWSSSWCDARGRSTRRRMWRSGGLRGWRRNTPSKKTRNTKPASLTPSRTGPKLGKFVVDKWFVDKGFGFGKVPTGEVIFIHASVVRGAEVLMIGTDAWVQVVRDEARAQGYRACKA